MLRLVALGIEEVQLSMLHEGMPVLPSDLNFSIVVVLMLCILT